MNDINNTHDNIQHKSFFKHNSDLNHSNKNKFKKKNSYCANCGNYGHVYKKCIEPITSYGILLFKIDDEHISDLSSKLRKKLVSTDINNLNFNTIDIDKTEGIMYHKQQDMQIFCSFCEKIKFLMVRRRNTLGYIEFIRGRYNIENIDGIIFLFKQMTDQEIKKIGNHDFDYLWDDLWASKKNNFNRQNEFVSSKFKFEKLKNKSTINLNFFVDNVSPSWNHAEWGFPKGRRNFKESSFNCAIREFKEETCFSDDEFIVLNTLKPFDEHLIGTNGINYRHIYYPAISLKHDKTLIIDENNPHQSGEIGDIAWFSYTDAMKFIRPYHTERKKTLTQLFMYIINNIADVSNHLESPQNLNISDTHITKHDFSHNNNNNNNSNNNNTN